MSEVLVYEAAGRARFGNRPRPWLARFVLQLPSNEVFWPQSFRNNFGRGLFHQHGLAMPDINPTVYEFEEAGMIVPISPVEQHRHDYVAVINSAWTPYAEFLGQHLLDQGVVEELPVFHLDPSGEPR